MNKCPECISCLRPVWIYFNRYLWCDFCDTFYHETKEDNTKYEVVSKEFIQGEREKEASLKRR